MTLRVAFNPTDSPVVVDDEGHMIAGLARGPVETTHPAVKQAVGVGQLVYVETGGEFDVHRPMGDVLRDVGDDPEKAEVARRAESATEQPRPTLLSKLGTIIEKGEA